MRFLFFNTLSGRQRATEIIRCRLRNAMPFVVFCWSVLSSASLPAQNYSYKNFLHDNEILEKCNRYIRDNKMDSLKLNLPEYKNRLGFSYYQYKALVANYDSDSSQTRYLDSAFMRGLTPLCLDVKKFDSVYLYKSFKANYLKSYDLKLVNFIDSIHYKDQQYRQQISVERTTPEVTSQKKTGSINDNQKKFTLKTQTKEQIIDSLWKLQNKTDSSDFKAVKEIIAKYGWPGAKLVGDYYCQRPGPDITIIIRHMSISERNFQIAMLKQVVELCKEGNETWRTAESLIFDLHARYKNDFMEFTFLEVQNNHLLAEESFFSIYNMAELLIKAPSKKISIKCKSGVLYNELKNELIAAGNLRKFSAAELMMLKKLNRLNVKKLDESRFEFVEALELNDNVVLYKFSQK